MFNKITVVVFALSVGLIIVQLFKFNNRLENLSVTDTKGIENFIYNYTNEICIGNLTVLILLLLCNITAYKLKELGWIFLPLLFLPLCNSLMPGKAKHCFTLKNLLVFGKEVFL